MEQKPIKKQSKLRKAIKWGLRILLILILIPIFIMLLLQIPPVQKWTVKQTTAYLSEKLEANVKLDEIYFNIFDGLALKNFKIGLSESDTILFTKSLNVNLKNNLTSLYYNRLDINSVYLDQAKIRLIQSGQNGKLNIDHILSKLFGGNTTDAKKDKINLKINDIRIRSLDFELKNEATGKSTIVLLDDGKIKIHDIDLNKNQFQIQTVNLLNPYVILESTGESAVQDVLHSKHESKTQDSGICFTLDKFNLFNGTFEIRNKSNQKTIKEINLDLENLIFGGVKDISAKINKINALSNLGFALKKFTTPQLRIDNNGIFLNDLYIETGNSKISRNIALKFNDINDLNNFQNEVIIDADLIDTKISLIELGELIPEFQKTEIYKKNKQSTIELQGQFLGSLNDLKGTNVNILFGDQLDFNGNFSLRNISDKDNGLISLNVRQLSTNVNFIKDIIPGFNPPKNFYELGNIQYKGYFDGYLTDFNTEGELFTDIGNAKLDVKLDVKKGSEGALYSGNIELENFDLHKWSGGNEDFGKVSLRANIRDGKSLILKNAEADMDATIDLLQFKKYDYKNIAINGKITPKDFIGTLASKDPNIDLDFDGKILFTGDTPQFDFNSQIRSLRLSMLNLSKDIQWISGDIKFKGSGNNANNIAGLLEGKKISIKKSDSIHVFDNVYLKSDILTNGNKKLIFNSEQVKANLEGKFDFNTIANDVKSIIKTNFQYHTRNWNFVPSEISQNQDFKFDINLIDPDDAFALADIKNVELKNFIGKGYINSTNKEVNIASSLPALFLKDFSLFNISLLLDNKASKGDLLLSMDSLYNGGKKYNGIVMQYLMNGDRVDYNIDAKDVIDSIQNISVRGAITPHPKGYTISILDNDLKLFNKKWKLSNESRISIGDKYIDLENVVATDGIRNIELYDINNKGLVVKLNKIDIASLNPWINYDKILFGGELSSTIRVNDIFNKNPSITGAVNVPELLLNNESFGELTVDLAKAENRPLEALISLNEQLSGQALKVNGQYDFETKNITADVKAKKLKLKWLEFILKKGIKDLHGTTDINADVSGNIDNLKINGTAIANGGSVKVIYLGETYYFDKQKFTITEKRIDLEGAVLKDSEGNPGLITGGLNHTLFKDFILDVSISGENVVGIRTNKYDNPIYYGYGKGQVSVDFIGSVNSPKMVINAVTRPGTEISIPIKESRSSRETSFITFVDKENFLIEANDTLKKKEQIKVEGISIEMNLTMTEDAKVNLIFDEAKNDIIKGVGKGNLKISMSNAGDFNMFGTYTITSGKYLFTALGFVNKEFKVKEGSTIRWNGDPINALINIETDYEVRTPISPFIAEYLVQETRDAASVSTLVKTKLILGNTLYKPSVKYDLDFPELSGTLKSYADSKLRILRTNENDLNNSVFGLLGYNSFLPSSTLSAVLLGNNFIQNAGINTLSEFVSSQLSLFITGIINEALEEDGLISGIDFDIDLRNNTAGATNLLPGANNSLLTEIEIRLKNRFRFWDERLSVNIGGNYVRQSAIQNLNNYIVPEFFIEYAITKDRTLNLKLYGKYDLDEIVVSNRRQKYGIGLRYKTEYGSLVETKVKLKKEIKSVLKKKE